MLFLVLYDDMELSDVAGYTTINQADKGQWQANQSTLLSASQYSQYLEAIKGKNFHSC